MVFPVFLVFLYFFVFFTINKMLEKTFYKYIKMNKLEPTEIIAKETKSLCFYLLVLVIYSLIIYLNKTSSIILNVIVKISIIAFSFYMLYLTTQNINYAVSTNVLDGMNLNLYYVLFLIISIFLANVFYTLFD